MKIPLQLALKATEGQLLNGDAAPAAIEVCTDTRTLVPGQTFVALRGERFDGHNFTAAAIRGGAAMLVIDRAEARSGECAALIVRDTKRAYIALAHTARTLFRGRVAAVTGSAGKTTTKEFLAQLLSVEHGGRVWPTPENENNEIGVSKLLLSASNEAHDILVVEMGARHYGDVARLVEIADPQVGILTNVGEAHLEIMGTRERLEATKWALFERGARAVVGAGDAVSRRKAPTLAFPPHWFAAQDTLDDLDEFKPLTALIGDRRLVHRCGDRAIDLEIDVRVPGAYNRANVAAASAGAIELGVPVQRLQSAIPELQLPKGRYDKLGGAGGLRIIYDAYNANASGMIATLDAFAAEAAARRIAVLASMAELGAESKALHERVGAHAAGRVDVLLVRGEYAADLARGARLAGLDTQHVVVVGTNAQAAAWLREHARADDVVLLKGSRKYNLEEIVEELRT